MTRFGRAPVRAARRDANEPAIVAALEAVGAAVQQLDPPLPDLLVSFRGVLLLIEVKDHNNGKETQAAKRRNHAGDVPASLTEQQVAWWRSWDEAGGRRPVVVLDAAEALAAIGALAPSDGPTIEKMMATTGIDRAGAEQAVRDGKRLANELIEAWNKGRPT